LPGRLARSQVATPSYLIDATTYSHLVASGFRRSGAFTYRPYCDHCRACTPVRVIADDFSPNRTQRRTQKNNSTLIARLTELKFSHEHYALYRRYQSLRHPGGGMDHDSREQYSHFLLQSNVHTRLVEFREQGHLRMVAIIDELADGLSSVYTFFDPERRRQSLGTYSVLWQIAEARRRKLPFVYLGYWIEECRKMSYKTDFRPIEGLVRGAWVRMAPVDAS
jgi:arginine-tRNA-protein transferase